MCGNASVIAPAQAYMQNVYEAKHLDTLSVRQNGQIVKRIVLRSFTSQDVLSIGAKKRYLASVHVYDRNSVRMLISKYDYCGIGAEAAGLNPGAVRRITYRSGGYTEYTYKSQPLTRDTLSAVRTIPSTIPGNPGTTAPSPTGVAGTDFYIVSQSLYRFYRFDGAKDTLRPMEVYRRGVTGWYRDTSFPYDSTTFCQVGSDVVVGFFKDRWKVVRRSGEGWSIYDIDSAFVADSVSYNTNAVKRRGPVGFGSTYFVFKYNWTLDSPGDFSYSIAAVHITEKGLKVRALGSGFHETNFSAIDNTVYVAPLRADCGENFFVLTSRAAGEICTAPMMASFYKFRNGSWSLFDQRQMGDANPFPPSDGLFFATNVPTHRIGKNFVVSTAPKEYYSDSIYVFQHTAAYLKKIDSLRSPFGASTQISVGDFYYTYAVGGAQGSSPVLRTWTGQGWEQTYLSAAFPGDNTSLASTTIFSNGRKLAFTGKTSTDTTAHVFAITHNGTSWSSPRHNILNGVWDFFRASPFGENGFLLEDHSGPLSMLCHLRAISFDGDSLRSAPVIPLLKTNSDMTSSWYWQPGRNFVASFRMWNKAIGTVDTNQVLTQCMDSLGRPSFAQTGYDIVIDRKTTVSGMGDSIVTTFAFENGIFDDQVSGGKYNKVTVTHPGATGKTVSYFYNDLGSAWSEEFYAGRNVPVLDGTSYRVREYNNSNSLVRETVQFTSADPVDSVRGVYFTALLRDSVVTDSIPRFTTYEYGNTAHRQVTRINETNSDGTQRVTRMKYPLDYSTTSGSSTSATVRMLDSMKNVTHMVNPVIERWVFSKTATDSSSVLSAALTTYRRIGANQVLPLQSFRLRDSAVVNFAASYTQNDSFKCDARYVPDATYDLYTALGNPVQVRNGNGIASSTIWGYSSALPVASTVNARTSQTSVGGECSYVGFESGTTTPALASDEDYWSLYGTNGYNVPSTDAHTGLYSQKLPGYSSSPATSPAPRFGPTRDFCPPDLAGQQRVYIISAWVKTESGTAASSARLTVYTKANTDANNNLYPNIAMAYASATAGDTYGSWVYLEVKCDLKSIRQLGGISDNELIRMRVYAENYDASHYMLVDDIRIHPADAPITQTIAYDPILLIPTYESDAANLFTRKTYDGFGRPIQMCNGSGSLLVEQAYYFSRDGAADSAFHANDPNYVKVKTYRSASDSSLSKSYSDGIAREVQKQIYLGDEDIIFHTKYDSLSRPRYVYKPYQSSLGAGKHLYDASVASHLTSYYDGLGISLGSVPYAESRYVADPLSRIELEGSPGTTFAIGGGHDIRVDYSGDGTNKWNVARRRNEQGDTTRVSTDLFGNAVRSEVLMGSSPSLVTSSTFDVIGNLTKSTPPLGDTYSTAYKYSTRSELRQKTSPDAGTVRMLYDKKGNLRLIRDAAHTGTGANAVNISASVSPGGQVSSNITLNNRGKLNVTLNASGYPVMGGNVTLQVKTTGGVVLLSLVTTGAPQSGSLILPQGTYSYTVRSTAQDPPPTPYTIQCQTQYPFAYNKYDGLGRIIESGEYVASDASAFTQVNADSAIFPPPSSVVLSTSAGYDTASTDAMASGQRNLKGKISWISAYRLGTLALTTFYSYDDMGRTEWVVLKGLGSSSKKIAYAYDLAGNITTKTYTDAFNTQNNYMWWYEYDQAGRPVRAYSGADNGTRISEAATRYVATGRDSQLTLGVGPAQTLSYTYNQRDWTRSINSTQFWESLGYETVQEVGSTLNVAPQYSGNISWMAYSQTPDTFAVSTIKTTTIGYGFGYDKANRLTSANFGYKYSGSWTSHDRYKMPQIGYDKNGNITSLVRYGTPDGTSTSRMDSLSYKYLANTNRLDYIWDTVAAAIFPTDIDNQSTGAYAYDGNGNVKADASRGVALVVYDMNNLPVSEYLTNGTLIQYAYDASGMRVQKIVGAGSPVWYVGGADGKTDVVYNGSTSNPCYNLFGAGGGLIGQVKRSGTSLSRQYHLKDHLGTVRVTLSPSMVVENFGGDLSQWTTVLGSGFAIESGWLSASSAGGDNVMVNSSATTIADGVVACDVSTPLPLPSVADVSIVVRYVDTNNFYLVYPCGNRLKIFKKLSGTYALKVDVALPDGYMAQSTWYRLQTTLSGSNIKVNWNGQQLINWTDPSSPFLSGKVGFRQDNSMHAHWDNFVAWSTGTPTILAYDDFYPFGQYMDYRSSNNGFADARYKYTEKERDSETGYDYFGARYYDARIGRWLSVDPLSASYSDQSPFVYALNSPLSKVDPTGEWVASYDASNNLVNVQAEKNDNLEGLYQQLGVSPEDFANKYGIDDLSKFEVVEGQTAFDVTDFVFAKGSSTQFSTDAGNMNCFSSTLVATGMVDQETQVQGGFHFTQEVQDLFHFSPQSSPNTGAAVTWVDKSGITNHSAVYVVKDQSGKEYFVGRAGPNSPVSLQTSDRTNQTYPNFQINYLGRPK